MSENNRQWKVVKLPNGTIKPENFELVNAKIQDIKDGEFLAQNVLLSLDPTQRLWLNGQPTYFPPIKAGEIMWAASIAVVRKSKNKNFPVGANVSSLTFGMQDYAVSNGEGAMVIPPSIPLDAWFAVFGHIGITAYFGLLEIGKAKAGETLVVSGAAGAVGSLVGQIGKIKGCRVIGIAGTEEKCQWLKDDLGFDAAINYKTANISEALKTHCPRGIDIYFENVGGEILDAVLPNMAMYGRIPFCGQISQYNQATWNGPANFGQLLYKRLKMEGFICLDYIPRAEEARTHLGQWLSEGKIKYKVDRVKGLENAVHAINRLFEGANTGKLLVDLV